MSGRTVLDQVLWEQRRSNRSLALEIGAHESEVSRWRAGLHVPEEPTRQAIAEALDREVLELWPDLHAETAA